jgi:hypothetical protein
MFDPGNMRVLAVKLFFVMEGAHKFFNVRDLRVTVLNKCTDTLLLLYEGSLSLVFGSCDTFRSDSTYAAWVMSGHGGVAVNMDMDASVVARRGVEGIDSGI